MPAFPVRIPKTSLRAPGEPAFRWSDLDAPYTWVRPAANWVAETNDWIPDLNGQKMYSFDEIQQLAEDYEADKTDYFPCFAINP